MTRGESGLVYEFDDPISCQRGFRLPLVLVTVDVTRVRESRGYDAIGGLFQDRHVCLFAEGDIRPLLLLIDVGLVWRAFDRGGQSMLNLLGRRIPNLVVEPVFQD